MFVPVVLIGGRTVILALAATAATAVVYEMTKDEIREYGDRIFNSDFDFSPFNFASGNSSGKDSGSAPSLSRAETEALDRSNRGLKHSKELVKSAKQKLNTARKYEGKKRSRQDRDGKKKG